jgi:hypothetical protein
MRHVSLLAIVGLLAIPYVVKGQTAPAPLLTAKDIADGKLMLFDGETSFGWEARGTAQWTVDGGCLRSAGTGDGMLATTTEFADFDLRADCWIDANTNSAIMLRCPTSGEITPMNAYEVNIYDAHTEWPTGSVNYVAKSKERVRSVGRWTSFRIVADGSRLIVEVDGKRTVFATDRKHVRGVIALQHRGDGAVRFRNITIKPLNLQSMFNAKDLAGWSPLPGFPAVCSVTPQGWLNVKSGRGDLQHEGRYGDFVFQSDIIVNGTHLNSGIFFRANAGERCQGYEMQIGNNWEGDDRTKVRDQGTGAIYNRQKARRVVSTDHEWFTATIVAHGYHIATWINGFQVTDFADTRPADERNARNGARKAAGIISLQGHDATTDVSFRNMRVVEMPAASR